MMTQFMTAWAWLKVALWKSVFGHPMLNFFNFWPIFGIKVISSKPIFEIQHECEIQISERENEGNVQKDIPKFLPPCPPVEQLIEEFGQVYREWNSNPGECQIGPIEMEEEKVKEERSYIGRNVNNWEYNIEEDEIRDTDVHFL